ncbi:MAG: recombination protein RecR [Chloroflexi bacterium]|nr:recombination protein RecR [Chloroflexota bacterium]
MNERPAAPGRSASTAAPVARLIEALHRLPTIGPKSAQRLTYYLLRASNEEAQALADAIVDLKEKIILCSICQNVTEVDPCGICTDEQRDQALICVVEEPLDILALERSRSYRGLYHVLHGVVSPMDGVGPDDLKLNELVARLRNGSVNEVIMATNPNLEGEATAMYVSRLVAPLGVRVTRLARGLPTGADLEYADDVTLAQALEHRQDV